ncbi:MAG: thioredoxin family protein [Planctomycetes bacterium]|nr:thioredoxin family protein [Planctomycetota bacterium]
MPRYTYPAAVLLLAVVAAIAGSFTTGAQDQPQRPTYFKAADALAGPAIEVPTPRRKHEWLENIDMDDAFKLAKKENRPVFATVRCLPCQQCSWIDNAIMKATTELEAKLQNFVCVRITTMRDMDARIFQFEKYQDLDCSWWGYFFDPEGRIYGVYGGIDIEGDKSCITIPGLMSAMDRVLKYHYQPKREEWNLFGDAPKLKGRADTPFKHDGWKNWAKEDSQRADKILKDKNECLHCHEVAEVVRQPRFDKKKFDKTTDFYVWPYPQNIGVELDLDKGLTIKTISKDGPAEKAYIEAGDTIEAANGQLLFSPTDLRRVLNELPYGNCKLDLLTRDKNGEAMLVTVELKGDWRQYDLGWRKSVAEANIGAHPGFPWPLKGDRGKAGVKADEMCIKPFFGKAPKGHAIDAGLKASDQIIAVNGDTRALEGRAFLAWFRMTYDPGDQITLKLVDDKGNQREIKYKVGQHIDD